MFSFEAPSVQVVGCMYCTCILELFSYIAAFEDMLQGSRKEIEQLFRAGESETP